MSRTEQELVAAGYAALRAGDSDTARGAFEAAMTDPAPGAVLEGLARSAYLDHEHQSAVDRWCEAYESYRVERDGVGAIRVARTLAYMYGSVFGDAAVMRGWFARALSLLADEGPCAESGWVALNRGMFEADRGVKEGCYREALVMARDFQDPSLEFVTLAYLGACLVAADRVDEGMALLDEALAAVAGRDVDDFAVVEEIFCQLFSACEHAHDVDRADQWIRVGEEIAARRNLPAVSAFCRTHYGGLLTVAGRWGEADDALTDAVRLWGLDHSRLQPGALVRLAELRVRQGRFEEAAHLLVGLDDDVEAARPLAAVHLFRGDADLAVDILERALGELDDSCVAAASLWALLVEARLVVGELDGAATSAEMLGACADRHPSSYLLATAAQARARVCLAIETDGGLELLRDASTGFARARTPLELAQARFELATALAGDRPKLAVAEARAALAGFEGLPASHRADAVAALLRTLGSSSRSTSREDGTLTRRESEVLHLLGEGLSNPEIADRLFISRKTVEHHVSRVLAKLGLRSRAEAAVYSVRAEQQP